LPGFFEKTEKNTFFCSKTRKNMKKREKNVFFARTVF